MSFDPEQVNEANFPGLSGSIQDEDELSQESECSDRELFKSKEKKKDKKKDKERGYKTFEMMETNSDEEDDRNKKKRSSIFRSRKAKTPKEKHKEKEKDSVMTDDKQKEKEIIKAEKKRSKSKEREAKKERTRSKEREKFGRKKAHTVSHIPTSTPVEIKPIFGIPLVEAVEHTKMYDSIELPRIVRECIDFIEEHGMSVAGIYRLSGVKSQVELLRSWYNRNEEVDLTGQDPNNVASLLKQYLRELPERLLTKMLAPKFEETGGITDEKTRVSKFQLILESLPSCNYTLLSWMIVHLGHVLQNKTETKMTIQNISIVMCPTLQISHRVLNLLFTHWKTLFKGVQIKKCAKPLRWHPSEDRIELPDNPTALEDELQRQETILAKMHDDLNNGLADKCTEEHLWEVQRIVTQLKRKLRVSRRISETRIAAIEKEKEKERDKEKEHEQGREKEKEWEKEKEKDQDKEKEKRLEAKETKVSEVETQEDTPKKRQAPRPPSDAHPVIEVKHTLSEELMPEDDCTKVETKEESQVVAAMIIVKEDEKAADSDTEARKRNLEDLAEVMAEQEELQAIRNELTKRLDSERQEVDRIKEEISRVQCRHYRPYPMASTDSLMSSDTSSGSVSLITHNTKNKYLSEDEDDSELQGILNQFIRDNQELERKNTQLSHDIHNEREACVELKVQIKLRQHPYYQIEPASIKSVQDVRARERELELFVRDHEREVESDSEIVSTTLGGEGIVRRTRRKSQSNPNVLSSSSVITATHETEIDRVINGVGRTAGNRRLERETSV